MLRYDSDHLRVHCYSFEALMLACKDQPPTEREECPLPHDDVGLNKTMDCDAFDGKGAPLIEDWNYQKEDRIIIPEFSSETKFKDSAEAVPSSMGGFSTSAQSSSGSFSMARDSQSILSTSMSYPDTSMGDEEGSTYEQGAVLHKLTFPAGFLDSLTLPLLIGPNQQSRDGVRKRGRPPRSKGYLATIQFQLGETKHIRSIMTRIKRIL